MVQEVFDRIVAGLRERKMPETEIAELRRQWDQLQAGAPLPCPICTLRESFALSPR